MRPGISTLFFRFRTLSQQSHIRFLLSLLVFGLGLSLYYLLFPLTAQGISTGVVISQVYGGGGNSGSVYKNDFVELFNRGNAPVSLNGWSVQYAAATSASWTAFNLPNVTLQPGQYFLLQLGAGGGGTTNLPTPDATAATNIATSAGKIALVSNTTGLSVNCPTGASIIDFVGYGSTANCSEGMPASGPSNNTSAILRATNGCTDTDANANDFATGTANPRNTLTTKAPCVPPAISIDDPMIVEGNSGTQLLTFTVTLSYAAPAGGVKFDYVTTNDTATTGNNDYVAAAQTNNVITAGNTTAEIKITINGDLSVEPDETFFVDLSNVMNATVAKSRGIGTIKNDDSPPTATVMAGGTICPGEAASIQATLTGAAPWNLTWSDGFTQTGVTMNPVTRNVSPSVPTSYSITAISNAVGSGTSMGSASVTISATPNATITAPVAVCANSTGNIASVPDAGSGAMYTWIITGGTITAGQGTRTLTWTAGSSGTVMLNVTVKNSAGCASNSAASVTVNPSTVITTPSQTLTICAGQDASFSVIAMGTGLTYQWRKGTSDIAGATNSTFTIPAATTTDAGSYNVVVKGDCGTATSTSATLVVQTAPTVTTSPTDQVVAPGALPSFTAAASGTTPISVQWQVSTDSGVTWSNIAGATNTTLALPAVALTDNGKQYRAQFTNTCGTTNSSAALLTVLPVKAEILDPLACIGDGTTLNVHAEIRNTSNVPVAGIFRAQLGANLATRNSCCVITGSGSCSFTGSDRVRWSGTLQPGQQVIIEYQVQVLPGVLTGTDLCITSTFELNAGAIATVQACTKVNCPIIPTGGAPAIGLAANDHTPGSVLFYHYYTSDVARPQLENTRLNITNTESARGVVLHLFFVSSDDCRVADTFLCLTANQTISLLASDYDPGTQGFLVVVAVDGNSGCPINFNYLMGSEFIKLSSGHATSLGAIAIAALPRGPMACDPTDTTARLDFDGTDYNLVPRALAVNNIQSPLDGNSTLLILNRIGGNFSTGTSTRLGDLLGLVYDDNERGYSFGFDPSGCQYVRRIFDGSPRLAPPLTKIIPRGHTGWMRLQHVTDSAMFGAIINLNPNGFSQGHNLPALSYTDASITIPLIPPPCRP